MNQQLSQSEYLDIDSIGDDNIASSIADLFGPEKLVVLSGPQVGAHIEIADKDSILVGTDYDCDVVLRTDSNNALKLVIDRYQGVRRVQLLEGSASLDSEQLIVGEYVKLVAEKPVQFYDVSFALNQPCSATADPDLEQPTTASNRPSIALIAIVSGMLLLGAIVAQRYWQQSAIEYQEVATLEERIASLDIKTLQILTDAESNMTIVTGRVPDQSTFRQLNLLVGADADSISLDLQVDSVLIESLQDVYRNHGIVPEIQILGKGHVAVETFGVEPQLLEELEKTLKQDLPMLVTLESSNTPIEPEDSSVSVLDPAKEVEAVIAGESAYVITRDQSRYFVGAVLPSGHVISAIGEGVVVMHLDGEETQLRF